MKVLIVEDVPSVAETVSLALEMRWPDAGILKTASGQEGIELADAESPDVIILDLGLPDVDGFEVLKRIRLFSSVPILVLTARSEEADIVKALEWGADDYMTKPFKQLELMARVRGIVRRGNPASGQPLNWGHIRYDPSRVRLTIGSNEVKISRTEGAVLGCLIRNGSSVTPYSTIAEAVWGADFLEASESIRVHVRHLREKLEEDPSRPRIVLNKPGVGYFLARTA